MATPRGKVRSGLQLKRLLTIDWNHLSLVSDTMLTHSPVTDRASALEFLHGRINYERTSQIPYHASDFKLDRTRRLLSRLGDPQLAYPALHIAGTKGKGSTATMVAAVLGAADYKTGLYTSPHLERLEERFVINGATCSESDFVRLAAEVADAVAELDASPQAEVRGATFFEVTTAMGFLHFARQRVDLAVLEVGLGGRLDSTNVCRPLACAITSISLDHMKQLGSTLPEIAAEKAGIAKPGVPLICNVVSSKPRETIHRIAANVGAPVRQLEADFGFTSRPNQRLDYWDRFTDRSYRLEDIELAMPGAHQAANAACAIALLRQLSPADWSIPERAMRDGLATARCAARVEVISERPLIVMDAAHNAASVTALLQSLEALGVSPRRLLIFGTTRDKDLPGMLAPLLQQFEHVIFTRYVSNPRAVPAEELAELARSILAGTPTNVVIESYDTPLAAWNRAQQLQPRFDATCITGSFFLAAELRSLIGG